MPKKLNYSLVVFFLIQIFLALFSQSLWAQDKAYQIGPRDVLSLAIYAGGEMQQDLDLTVSSHGMITVPFIGSVRAKGLTIPQLSSQIKEPLARDFFVDPEINIQVKEYHSLQYYISGAVKEPGLYEMTSKVTLMELIARSGGVLPGRGNIAYILRSSSGDNDVGDLPAQTTPAKVNLTNLLDKGDMSHNLLLQTGDVVYIPLETSQHVAESKIYVEGEVVRPGIYEFQPGLTALNACIMAGGFGKFAAPNRARIIRKKGDTQIVIKINLDSVKQGAAPDMELRPGDMIHIPETWL